MRHYPVMREEVVAFLAVRPEGYYLDATAGLGGHTRAIAQRLTTGRVIACDRDAESLEIAQRNLEPWKEKVIFRKARFSELERVLADLGIRQVDGLVADLGPSYYQLTDPERGFSLMAADAPLDARMDRTEEVTAADLINQLSEKELADLFYRLAGERRARKLARAITRARPIHTVGQLVRLVESVAPGRKSRLHPATRVAMALRMAVNRELEELEALLEALPRLVAPGGRAVIIAFHSGEDTKVKHRFQELARQGSVRLLTKHVVRPRPEEVRENAPSRSARLRAVERIQREAEYDDGNMGNAD
jgi:16S rRNA (cytosine1402-N4)-methyltransferase